MLISMSACSLLKTNTKTVIDFDELKKLEGSILEIKVMPESEMTEEEFKQRNITYKVTYDGYVYIPNPVNYGGVKMSDEDYEKIVRFCIDTCETDKFKDYKEDVCDGVSYTFVYIDENSVSHKLYNGYTTSNNELKDIVNTVCKYQLE